MGILVWQNEKKIIYLLTHKGFLLFSGKSTIQKTVP